ncbi:MAG: spike base protein, RCAP_Rcc01079 family [Beijerinckiaceae bacterium]
MSNPDIFSNTVGRDLVPVVPNDGADLPQVARALRIGVAGTLRFTSLNGVVRNTSVASGEVTAFGAARVHATGTTATGIEAVI